MPRRDPSRPIRSARAGARTPRPAAGPTGTSARAGAWRIPPTGSRSSAAAGAAPSANPAGRYEPVAREAFDDGWDLDEEPPPLPHRGDRREAAHDHHPERFARHLLRPLDQSLPGLRARLLYCFARPTHAFQGLSLGPRLRDQDLRQAERRRSSSRRSCARRGYEPKTIALGANTDPYQPVERRFRITRGILEVLDRANHPVGIVTKSALVTRDIDILARMADRQLAKVAVSVTTLDPKLARRMEPRAATPAQAARHGPAARGGRASR